MAIETIDFNKVIEYSKANCFGKSQHLCATYVKRAFEKGGCKYVSGNGWSNQNFCKTNGFQCIGDFVPVDKNPRAHNGKKIQFPDGYVQQVGDICLIKHGTYGHICYAYGTTINDWVSDYWQNSTYGGQQDGTGPYCYSSGVEQVQFWRHSSVMGNTPEVEQLSLDNVTPNESVETTPTTTSASSNNTGSNRVKRLSSSGKKKNRLNQSSGRKNEFENLLNSMVNQAPELGRDVNAISSDDLYDSNILKSGQESKKERV